MVTGAENAGRLDSYENLANQGVVQKKVWIATPDERTRESHLDIDGEEVDIEQEFSNGLMYPADPNGEPEEVWNCRCSMRTHIIGFMNADGTITEIGYERDTTMHDEQMQEEKDRREAEAQENAEEQNAPAEDAEDAKDGKIDRDYDSDFAKGYGKEYYDTMCDLVDDCENDDLKEVWGRFQSQIKVPDPNYKGRGKETAGRIYVDAAKDAKGSDWQAKYETTFHESGHAIDFLSAREAESNGFKLHYSSAYQNGAFPATIREEVSDMVKAKDIELKELFKEHAGDYVWMHENGFISEYSWRTYERTGQFFGGEPKYSKSFAYKAIEKEVRSLSGGGISIADLSDILEGATSTRISCGYGHGKSYWDKIMGIDDKLATEAFAEMTSATITNDASLQTLKQYLPRSYAMYEDMIKELAKGGK